MVSKIISFLANGYKKAQYDIFKGQMATLKFPNSYWINKVYQETLNLVPWDFNPLFSRDLICLIISENNTDEEHIKMKMT